MTGFTTTHRTLIDPLTPAVQDGRTTAADKDEILGLYAEADAILAEARARAQVRAADRRLTPDGKREDAAADAARVRQALAPITARIAAAERAHAAWAPRMVRDAHGRYREVSAPPERPEAELLRELRDRQRIDHLLGLDPTERGARLRSIAQAGEDPDGLLEAALRAPSFEQSAFKTAALQHLGQALDETPTALGAAPDGPTLPSE